MKWRRGVWLGLWILSLTAISCYGGTISYGFFFGVTLLPIISLIYLAVVYWRFKVYQRAESRNMVCGQPVPYFFVLQNDDFCAFTSVSVRMFSSFSHVEDMPEDTEYELLPGDKYTYETKLICRYRGEYEVGLKEIVVTDFFRLFRFRYRISGTIKALVLPGIVRVDELHSIGDMPALLQRDTVAADVEPDAVVRDYVEGDSIRQIHWKATAREQKLKIRNRIGEEKQGIAIFCDTKRYSRDMRIYLPLENRLLEIVIALGIFFADRNMAFSVYYGQNGVAEEHVEGMQSFQDFYQRVAGVSFAEEADVADTLSQVMDRGILSQSKVVFGVLHELNESIMESVGRLAAEGSLVVLYVVTNENAEEHIRLNSDRIRIVTIPPDTELEGRL